MATPVVLTTGARPITAVESGGVPMTPVDTLGEPVTVVDALGEPVVLINNDGTPAFLAYSAKTYLGGVAPYHWLDFVDNRALYAGADVGNVTGATGYSFSRASQGYYTNSDGTLTLFGYNLCLQSETFENATWQKARCSIVANQYTAPDGTLTGDQLVEDTTTNSHPVFQTIASLANATAYTFSIYLLAVDRTSANIAFSNTAFSTGCNVTFTLSGAGTATPAGTIPSTATIEAVGGGWYRCTVTATSISAGSGDVFVQPFNGATSYLGNGLPAIGVWGAQLEPSASLGSYVPTTSAAAGALRRGDRGVLIEGSRTNLLLQSQTFDNAGWAKVNSTVTANSAAAPDGTTTADTLTEGAVTDEHYAAQAVTKAATATTYTASVYAKSSTRNILIVCRQASVSANNATMGVNLTTGAVGLAAASAGTFAAASGVVTALANGWFRIAMTFTTSTETALSVRHYITDGTYNGGFAGNGTSGISIWGAQLLTAADQTSTGGAYQRIAAATDYDTSNPVWRPYLAFDGTDDSFGTSSIDFSGTDEMSVFAGVSKLSDAAQGIVAELSANVDTSDGTFRLTACNTNTVADLGFRARGTTSQQAISAASFPSPRTSVLRGFADISGDITRLFENGIQIASSSSDLGTGNFGNHQIFIGRRNNTSSPLNGRLYSLAVLGRTATAAEISAMEAWVNGKTGAF